MSPTQWPIIRKAQRIVGKNLDFRDANVDDAAFILSLRTDPEKSRYLSAISADLSVQHAWLTNYSATQDQAYFIIEYQNEPIGTVRLYDPREDSFCWGSWILKESRPSQAAIESALMVYSYAFDYLAFHKAHFAVHKGNQRVWEFHERFGAERIGENQFEYFYSISEKAIRDSMDRYSKYLPQVVTVFWL